MSSRFPNVFDDAASPDTVRKAERKLRAKVATHRGVIGFPRWTLDVLVIVCACIFIYAYGWCHLFPFGPCRCDPDMPGEMLIQLQVDWFWARVYEFIDICLFCAMRLGDIVNGRNMTGFAMSDVLDITANLYDFAMALFVGTFVVVLLVGITYTLLLVCVLGGFRPLIQRVRENHAARHKDE